MSRICLTGLTLAGGPKISPARRTAGAALVALVLALISIPMLGCAQRPAMEWQQFFDGLGAAISVQQTPDDGYLIGGSQWLLKTDSTGSEEWRKSFNSGHTQSIAQTADGGCIVCGWKVCAECEEPGAWLMKLDAQGNKEWETYIGRGYASSVQQTTEGGYIVGAYASCPVVVLEGDQQCDIRLVKLDSAGNTQWEKTLARQDRWSRMQQSDLSVRQTSDGGYIIQPTNGTTDSRLIKTDSVGNEEWSKTYENMRTSSPVEQTADGGYVFLTREVIPGTGEFVNRNWLIKTDSAGEMERLKLFNYEYGWSVQPTTDRGYVVLAFKKEVGSLLIKADSRVMEDWERRFRTDEGESVQSVQETWDGGYIVAATICPDASQSDPDDCRTWLVKIAGPPTE
jgi:hypothetical protein